MLVHPIQNDRDDEAVDDTNNKELLWQMVDAPLDDRHAVTFWRAVRYVPSLHAHDGYLTLVELQPKTGRFHPRRHMAWTCQMPIWEIPNMMVEQRKE
jgi:23S rRNA-/tRNA-specific pseudouridylate synthase